MPFLWVETPWKGHCYGVDSTDLEWVRLELLPQLRLQGQKFFCICDHACEPLASDLHVDDHGRLRHVTLTPRTQGMGQGYLCAPQEVAQASR